ncbi:succinate dehydrogenase/fumarate reductase flavoprotein subunit [Sphingobium lactosutens]|uniref:FAD-dependent oxidoreductase n=1 Tax=Sphingobium lactosutens TaxID=522773 RepID=UPI0015BCCC8E|nr:FAD-binding protein [Sphingobium lactosutens]NWK96148.1 succinate dehydrogenase/fumarate reductase flavoprotein subunit [Sphingobium lactosutens]
MSGHDVLALTTDVLIVGGGMAACWAATAAARAGARVVLVDKGFVGTSGVTATGGPNHWWVPPDPAKRAQAVEDRLARAFDLAERDWMARIIDETWRALPELAGYYPFDSDGRGGTFYSGVRGPEYMRALRRFAADLGVSILDHHPALELLVDHDGVVVGAAGHARLDDRLWAIQASSVVLATGGCAFRSGLIGSHGNTGDGLLMAAEAGAALSGMEFSVSYSLSPAWNSTRTLPYFAARFFDQEGRELDVPPPMSGEAAHLKALATAMIEGPVLADLSDAPALLKQLLRRIQPASMPPFERRGVDLFENRFPIRLFGEGTVRGTGGLQIVDEKCRTSVEGLYAAGDAATRELIAGATSGGGAQNAAWALTSGRIAGQAAARAASQRKSRATARGRPVGGAGLRPAADARPIDLSPVIPAVQASTIDFDGALWRSEAKLSSAKARLDLLWRDIADHAYATGIARIALREQAAMVAAARWVCASALARTESRGMHMRTDKPGLDPALGARLLTGGLDNVWTRLETDIVSQRIEAVA